MIIVSKKTENFVECIQLMNHLYEKVYKSLKEIYSTEDTENIIDKQFINEFSALEKSIESLLIRSIKENISDINTNEI